MEVKAARAEDAAAICTVVRRSIIELCAADHRDDPHILESWLANKHPENVAAWIAANPEGVFVAVEGGSVIGAAILLPAGEVVLNYVSPDARFRGVSKILMSRLEERARELGLARIALTATTTARRFYLGLGYEDIGETSSIGGMRARRMAKELPEAPGSGTAGAG